MRDLQGRVNRLEDSIVGVTRRMDRMGGDVELIERRLDLADAPAQ